MTTLAAALLRDVTTRYRFLDDQRTFLSHDEVLAALTAAFDGVDERAVALTKVGYGYDLTDDDKAAITALLAENAALRAERDETYAYAKHLVEAIFANGKFDAPQWEPLEDTLGVLTQIDNMVAGIRARAEAAEAQIAALTARVEGLTGALHNCVGMLDCLVAESGRSIEWGQEDPFRMGEWFEPDDLKQLAQARAALSATTEEGHD